MIPIRDFLLPRLGLPPLLVALKFRPCQSTSRRKASCGISSTNQDERLELGQSYQKHKNGFHVAPQFNLISSTHHPHYSSLYLFSFFFLPRPHRQDSRVGLVMLGVVVRLDRKAPAIISWVITYGSFYRRPFGCLYRRRWVLFGRFPSFCLNVTRTTHWLAGYCRIYYWLGSVDGGLFRNSHFSLSLPLLLSKYWREKIKPKEWPLDRKERTLPTDYHVSSLSISVSV